MAFKALRMAVRVGFEPTTLRLTAEGTEIPRLLLVSHSSSF